MLFWPMELCNSFAALHRGKIAYALEEMVFHVYPLFLFFGMRSSLRHPDLLRKTIQILAWACGVYGLLFVVFIGRSLTPWYESDVEVPIFGEPVGSGVVLLGLFLLSLSSREFNPVHTQHGCPPGDGNTRDVGGFSRVLYRSGDCSGRMSQLV